MIVWISQFQFETILHFINDWVLLSYHLTAQFLMITVNDSWTNLKLFNSFFIFLLVCSSIFKFVITENVFCQREDFLRHSALTPYKVQLSFTDFFNFFVIHSPPLPPPLQPQEIAFPPVGKVFSGTMYVDVSPQFFSASEFIVFFYFKDKAFAMTFTFFYSLSFLISDM